MYENGGHSRYVVNFLDCAYHLMNPWTDVYYNVKMCTLVVLYFLLGTILDRAHEEGMDTQGRSDRFLRLPALCVTLLRFPHFHET